MKVDEALMQALEKAVESVEASSSTEVVVAIAAQSGIYRDVELALGAVLAWIVMGEMVLMPLELTDYLLLPMSLFGFALGYLVARFGLHHGLIPSKRRRRQVTDAARAAFVREHVGATRERTGVLVYLSMLEGDVELVPDYGVEAKVPSAVWNDLRAEVLKEPHARRPMALAEKLGQLAPRLGELLPRQTDDVDELPNRPRILE